MSKKPSKLNDRRIKRICDALAVGATYQTAAEYAGISRQTLAKWIKHGERMHFGKQKQLVEAVYEAQGRAKIAALATIARASKDGDWKAAAWFLERREPEGYGRSDRVKLTATVDATVEDARASKLLAGISDSALAELAALVGLDADEDADD